MNQIPKNVIDFFNNRKSSRIEIQWIILEVQSKMKGFIELKAQPTPRSCNVITHSLARLDLEKCRTFVWVGSYPHKLCICSNSLNE